MNNDYNKLKKYHMKYIVPKMYKVLSDKVEPRHLEAIQVDYGRWLATRGFIEIESLNKLPFTFLGDRQMDIQVFNLFCATSF